MGKAMSVLNRQINRINVENRAHRVISKTKPTPAPRHSVQDIQKTFIDHVEIAEDQFGKDDKLDNRLKDVFVQSHDPNVLVQETNTAEQIEGFDKSRRLPSNRQPYNEMEYRFQEPAVIPKGRCSLQQAIKFISDHKSDGKTWNAASISKEYNIKHDKIEKVLHYYHIFQVGLPEKPDKFNLPLVAKPDSENSIEAGKV